MTFRPQRPPGWFVQRDIRLLIESFPSERIRLVRRVRVNAVSSMGVPGYEELPVFEGKALVVPAGGDVSRFGLGQVEEDQPQLLISGDHDIRQGDLLTHTGTGPSGQLLPGRKYIVQYAPNHWRAFHVVRLNLYQQGS